MNLAISLWSYVRAVREERMTLSSFLDEAASIGVKGVELLDFFGAHKADVRDDVKAKARDLGLQIPIFSVAQNFAKADANERLAELDKIKVGIEAAKFYGSPVVRVFAGDVSPGVTFEDARQWIIEGLSQASLLADDAEVKLALENHGTLAGKGDQVVGIIEDVRFQSGCKALGANPDTGNFFLMDRPSSLAVEKVAKYAYMVHFKDFRYATSENEGFPYGPEGLRFYGTALGEGEVDLFECVARLADARFRDWLSLEYEGEEDPMTAVPRSIAFAEDLLAKFR